ncbi:MAG: nucleoside deaminase [Rectinemataceae bacterium]
MLTERDRELLGEAIRAAARSRAEGMHPFGAVLADAEGNILLEAHNSVPAEGDVTGHAETNLIRAASPRHSPEFLAHCTLYSSAEPCAMCSGALYWSGIGRLVYALSERELLELTGDDPENPTMSLPCREVLVRGQRHIEVLGPIPSPGAREVHEGFWNPKAGEPI